MGNTSIQNRKYRLLLNWFIFCCESTCLCRVWRNNVCF